MYIRYGWCPKCRELTQQTKSSDFSMKVHKTECKKCGKIIKKEKLAAPRIV